MNKYILLLSLGLFFGAESLNAREFNLVMNPTFANSLLPWQHEGTGVAKWRSAGCVELNGGHLVQFLDLDYLEHAAIDNTVVADRYYQFSVKAKGDGQFRMGVGTYAMHSKYNFETTIKWSAPQTLSKEFKDFTFKAQENNPAAIYNHQIIVEYMDSGKLEVSEVNFHYLDANDFEIKFSPAHLSGVPGDMVSCTVSTGRPEQKLKFRVYDGHIRIAQKFTDEERVTDKNGNIVFQLKIPSAVKEGIRVTVSDPISGVKRSWFVTLVDPSFKKILTELGSKLRQHPAEHLLFIGDSLSDYDRGRNYIDLVGSFLPAQYSIKNVGVGGDYAARTWDRLQGGNAYRQEMYNNIFIPKPTMIFIFLGGNDTKASSSSNFEKPVTPPSQQAEIYHRMINYLRTQTQARLVFIGAPSSYYPYQEEISSKKLCEGTPHNRFGEDRHIVNFNRVLKELAKEQHVDYLDFYKLTKNDSDKRELFLADDGIHLSLKGHALLAKTVLDYLSNQ